ncbi:MULTISPECIES: OmpA family protein [Aliivibrio]|uniref:OmpA family protein n=1 Tax=Aliivibrio finisterrensis TaxID=511998 RepID=A0A4Q5KX85_9GAMM|nr:MULTISPECIES: OmpA family protein [Aliivibrio]MDD9178016.1 OmpA family protein [Aliivibrio sp. A6]RYU51973.1 OmpA family protein [Aliivibrio finisterrensis]RYU53696.1 OmpA family protein [Aliivibrio finisterrensis]RYU57687.1 OmpA family protein [Aliivibrio finisterrensis]RYU66141.1 OmpA family protein [Aliivibrio finisterrensis]
MKKIYILNNYCKPVWLILCILALSGCSSTPKPVSGHTDQKIFSTYQKVLNLKEEPLYLFVNKKQQKIGKRVIIHSLFKSGQTEIESDNHGIGYLYFSGKNASTRNSYIAVVGHTDNTGSASRNINISKKRAHEASLFLKEGGVKKLYTYSFGEYLPKYPNTSKVNRALNRRIEILEFDTREDFQQYMNEFYLSPYAIAKKNAANKPPTAKKYPPKRKITYTQEFIGFGGIPYNESKLDLVSIVGDIQKKSSLWSPIKKAHANIIIPESCINDSPPNPVKYKKLKTSKYLPGMNSVTWWSKVNGHAITVGPIAVARKNAEPVEAPIISIYKNYNSDQSLLTYSYPSTVKTYEGEHSILYRIFPEKHKVSLRCIDLVLPKSRESKTTKALKGKIYYHTSKGVRMRDFLPHLN